MVLGIRHRPIGAPHLRAAPPAGCGLGWGNQTAPSAPSRDSDRAPCGGATSSAEGTGPNDAYILALGQDLCDSLEHCNHRVPGRRSSDLDLPNRPKPGQVVPRDRLVAMHAPLGEVERPGAVEFIRAMLPPGMPQILAPVASGRSLLDNIEERGLFPTPKVRWCTSSLKRGPIKRELREYLKAHPRFGDRIVSAMGIRAKESPARARNSKN